MTQTDSLYYDLIFSEEVGLKEHLRTTLQRRVDYVLITCWSLSPYCRQFENNTLKLQTHDTSNVQMYVVHEIQYGFNRRHRGLSDFLLHIRHICSTVIVRRVYCTNKVPLYDVATSTTERCTVHCFVLLRLAAISVLFGLYQSWKIRRKKQSFFRKKASNFLW